MAAPVNVAPIQVVPVPVAAAKTAPLKALRARWLAKNRAGWRSAMELLFPPACSFCHSALNTSSAGMLCDDCRGRLVDERQACLRCGVVGLNPTSDGGCVHCQGT